MMWVIALGLLAVAFAVRAHVNLGATTATPDEKVYSSYAANWRPGRTYAGCVSAFLAKPELEVPPTRYLFFAVSSLATIGKKTWVECFNPLTWVAVVSGALAAPLSFLITQDWKSSLLIVSSPLSIMLSRRALQDGFAALHVLLGLWAVSVQNPFVFAAAVAAMLATREATLLYIPAMAGAWLLHSWSWVTGGAAAIVGFMFAIVGFYVLGGRRLIDIFKKLGQSTDYVRRFQSGMPHRILVDLVLVSPVTTIAGALATVWAPTWIVGFVVVAIVTHGFITPKNIRFLLAVEVAVRMLCAWLPGPWPWVVLVGGTLVDLRMYGAIGGCKDPVTYNLVVRTEMYSEKSP